MKINELNVKDLRIGNWVNNFRQIIQVEDGEDIDDHKEFNCYQPIPLTEGWLIKFGFTEAEINEKWYYLGKIWICVIDGVICFGDEFKQVNLNIQCKYIHQLQNLYFALTNEELTIKL